MMPDQVSLHPVLRECLKKLVFRNETVSSLASLVKIRLRLVFNRIKSLNHSLLLSLLKLAKVSNHVLALLLFRELSQLRYSNGDALETLEQALHQGGGDVFLCVIRANQLPKSIQSVFDGLMLAEQEPQNYNFSRPVLPCQLFQSVFLLIVFL